MSTEFSKMFNCKYPIIGAPMFLVSNVEMVSEISLAGGVGTFPSLNCRTTEELETWIGEIKEKVKGLPFGVNLILHKSNERYAEDKEIVLKHKVPLIISSLGNPTDLVKEARAIGTKVFCDVINMKHAKKAVSAGADGLIVVSSGAGGHAGPLSPFASIPWFKSEFSVPIIAAGAIASGHSMAAALALGADGVSVGTRFIASKEAQVEEGYKKAIVNSSPESIFMSRALSGVNASVMRTEHTENFYQWENSLKGKLSQWLMYKLMKKGLKLKKKYSWNNVWSAGQSVGEVHEVLSCREIVEKFNQDFKTVKERFNSLC